MRRLALLAVCVPLLLGAGGKSAAFSYGWNLKPVSGNQKWLRVYVEGEGSTKAFAVRGVDFTISEITSVRTSGGPEPSCGVSGTPATFRCDGPISGGMSVFVRMGVTGSGGTYEIGFQVGNAPLVFQRQTQGPPFLPMQASLSSLSATKQRVTFAGSGHRFEDFEILPFGYRITRVTKLTVNGASQGSCKTEGSGIDCSLNFPSGAKGVVEFETAAGARNVAGLRDDIPREIAEALLHGPDGTADELLEPRYDLEVRITPKTSTGKLVNGAVRFSSIVEVTNVAKAPAKDSPATTVTLNPSHSSLAPRVRLGCGSLTCNVVPLAPGQSQQFPILLLAKGLKVGGTVKLSATVPCSAEEPSCQNNHYPQRGPLATLRVPGSSGGGGGDEGGRKGRLTRAQYRIQLEESLKALTILKESETDLKVTTDEMAADMGVATIFTKNPVIAPLTAISKFFSAQFAKKANEIDKDIKKIDGILKGGKTLQSTTGGGNPPYTQVAQPWNITPPTISPGPGASADVAAALNDLDLHTERQGRMRRPLRSPCRG